MIIRKLTQSDIETCVEIYKLNNDDSTDKWIQMVYDDLGAAFEKSKFIIPVYYVIEEDSKVIAFAGYSNCGFDIDVYGLTWCNVHPEYQGKGYGKILVEKRLESIKEDGGRKVLSSQRESVTWHLERFGFERIDINGVYDNEQYFLMRLNLK